MQLSDNDLSMLRRMLNENEPLYGGCFDERFRMQLEYPDGHPLMEALCREGLVERATKDGKPVGYVLTERGREVAAEDARRLMSRAATVCPTCKRPL